MADGTKIHSRLESKSSIERFNKLENYVARLMKKSRTYDDDIFITLTKQQLVDPNFSKAISQNLFAQNANGKKVFFNCIDKDLFFTEKEALTLLQNYEQIQKQGGDLFFGETRYETSLDYPNNINGKLTSLKLGSKVSYRVSFWEVMGINTKLLRISKKINEFSTKHNLSPYEKYLTCFNYIANIKYSKDDFTDSTLVGTIKENKGCCVGKSQYLRTLLKLCDINSCCIIGSAVKELVFLKLPMCEKYYPSATVGEDEVPLSKANSSLTQALKNESKLTRLTYCDHCISLIYMEDPKYNLHGMFVADAVDMHAGFLPIADLKHLQGTFNFTSYAALSHGCGFEDFIAGVNPKDLSDKEYDKIEKEYFAFAKTAIKQQVLDRSPKDLDAVTQTKLKSFSSKIAQCRSFEQIKDVFDDYRVKKTKFGNVCEQVFEDVFSDELGMLALSTEACENRAALEGCPLANAMPVEMFESSKKIADDAYQVIFGEETSQES